MIQGNDGGANISFNGGQPSPPSTTNRPPSSTTSPSTPAIPTTSTAPSRTTPASPSPPAPPAPPSPGATATSPAPAKAATSPLTPTTPTSSSSAPSAPPPAAATPSNATTTAPGRSALSPPGRKTMRGYGAGEHKYRFNWTYPIVFSPHDPNTIYIGGNRVFKTTDEGQTWEPISPDLTFADPETLVPTGGPVNKDAIGAETYATVFAFAESPHETGRPLGRLRRRSSQYLPRRRQELEQRSTRPTSPDWTDDLLHRTVPLRPGHGLPRRHPLQTRRLPTLPLRHPRLRRHLDPHHQRHPSRRLHPRHPRRSRAPAVSSTPAPKPASTSPSTTAPTGAASPATSPSPPSTSSSSRAPTSSPAPTAAPSGSSTTSPRSAHPGRRHRLTALTCCHPARHRRVLPGIDWSENVPGWTNYLGGRGGGYIVTIDPDGHAVRTYLDLGENPPAGAIIRYRLAETPTEPLTLTFTLADGTEIRSFSSRKPRRPAESRKSAALPAKPGWNRFVWDLRTPPPPRSKAPTPPPRRPIDGPFVKPGDYTVTLKVGDTELTQPFTVVKPSSLPATQNRPRRPGRPAPSHPPPGRPHRQDDQPDARPARRNSMAGPNAPRSATRDRGRESSRSAPRQSPGGRENPPRPRPPPRLGRRHQHRRPPFGEAHRPLPGRRDLATIAQRRLPRPHSPRLLTASTLKSNASEPSSPTI